MSKLVRCDRCGAMEPENGGYDVTLTPQYVISFVDETALGKDLCRKCAADFKAFMRNEDVSRRHLIKED